MSYSKVALKQIEMIVFNLWRPTINDVLNRMASSPSTLFLRYIFFFVLAMYAEIISFNV